MSLRCWLFGHEWLHLDTAFLSGESRKLRSSHLCDRCDEERTVVIGVSYADDEPARDDRTFSERQADLDADLEEMKGE